MNLAENGGNLDGNIVAVLVPQAVHHLLEAMVGFRFAQDGFAKLVDVHPDAGLAPAAQMGTQLPVLRRKNHVGALLPQLAGNHGHHHARKLNGQPVPHLHGQAVHAGQVFGHAVAAQQVAEQLRAAGGGSGAEYAVRQGQGERLARGIVHHPFQLLRLLPFMSAHPGIGLSENGFSQFNRLGCQLLVGPFVTARRRHQVRNGGICHNGPQTSPFHVQNQANLPGPFL